ncbi:MAG: protoheme IX farnesyltransferase [Elusimicrobia bacterium]|nr:protoheme IX farnesyltransferase [Elusimicrobiota bacterium]
MKAAIPLAVKAYLQLAKPRIALMVALTVWLGWALAGGTATASLFLVMLGSSLAAAACGALNQRLEIAEDGIMHRTRGRPLPTGRISPNAALAFGLVLAAAGPAIVWAAGGATAGAFTAATIVLYVLVYTPLKKVTPQTTWIGAAAGATSPLIGWVAAGGPLDARAFTLFAIQFLWQIPHFLALFWIYREDYARAGFKVMPVVHPGGGTTAIQIAVHSFTLLPATIAPALVGLARPGYAIGAFAVSGSFLLLGLRASWTMTVADNRRLFLASLAFLPLIFGMILFGGV